MRYLTALLLIALVIIPSSIQAGSDAKFRGKYEVIGNLDSLKGAKQVEMLEFFNYSCGHCYKFLETSKRLHTKFKDKLFHKKYPVYWGNQTPYPAMAFYISDELGVEEKFTQELFDTNFKYGINIFKPRAIKILAKDYGIEKEMTQGMESADVKAKVQQSLTLSQQYKAGETPTIIINKTLKVAPSMYGGSVDKMTDGLELILEDVLNNS